MISKPLITVFGISLEAKRICSRQKRSRERITRPSRIQFNSMVSSRIGLACPA